MRIPRIYLDQPLQSGSSIHVLGDRAHYVLDVLRMKAGQQVVLFNGKGGQYAAEIAEMGRRRLVLEIGAHDPVERESPLCIELQQSLLGHDKMDLVIQKAVELGVSALRPVITARCKIHLDDKKREKRLQHWHGIMVSACEQCGRNRLPALFEPRSLAEVVGQTDEHDVRLALLPEGDRHLSSANIPGRRIALIVGPEGGLTSEECSLVRAAGYIGLSLGPRILRTETAGMAAISVLQSRLGDLD